MPFAVELLEASDHPIARGAHKKPEEGLCLLEWTLYLGGWKHRPVIDTRHDLPMCVCPILADYAIAINNAMPHDDNDLLLPPYARLLWPFAKRLIGTRRCPNTELRRLLYIVRQFDRRILGDDFGEAPDKLPAMVDLFACVEVGDVASWETVVQILAEAIEIRTYDEATIDTGGEFSSPATMPTAAFVRQVESACESRSAELSAREQAANPAFATSVTIRWMWRGSDLI